MAITSRKNWAALSTQAGTSAAKVVIADINEAAGNRVTRSIQEAGAEAVFVQVDVRDVDSVRSLVRNTVERYGRIDILYHNAVDVQFVNQQDRRLTELPEETWDRMIDLALTGTYRCCKYVGQQMITQCSGSIILTATVDSSGVPDWTPTPQRKAEWWP